MLITGNEVLSGRVRDTNSVHIARALVAKGVEPSYVLTCGDAHDDLLSALRFLVSQCDSIVVTGGLGPTVDDLTAQVVATLFSRECVFFPEAWRVCESFFHRQGRTQIPDSNRKQAMLPQGARVFSNPHGTAAGFVVSGVIEGCDVRVFCLPGVPREMEPMFDGFVLPELVNRSELRYSRAWQIFMQGESVIQQKLEPIEAEIRTRFPRCEIRYQAKQGVVSWSISQAVSSLEHEVFLSFLETRIDQAIRKIFGSYLLFQGEKSVVDFLVTELTQKRITLACAESCTGGLIAQSITAVPGASRVFQGAAVTYSNESKADLLGVDMRLIERHGAVSSEVAHAMSIGALRAFSSDISVSTTGVAGPGGGTPHHPVGMVCFGLALSVDKVVNRERVVQRLAELEWKQVPSKVFNLNGEEKALEFVSERRFGTALVRDVIQQRAMAFALGTLVVALRDMT